MMMMITKQWWLQKMVHGNDTNVDDVNILIIIFLLLWLYDDNLFIIMNNVMKMVM